MTDDKIDTEKKGLNWDQENIDTFKDWLKIASFNVQCLEYGIKEYKSIIRYSVIVGLILSTASGTTSSARFGLEVNQSLDTALNISFVIMTFSIAIFTGAIKVFQIQERLEEYIKTKQEWLNFITVIGTEFQLPLNLRQNAINLIIKYKDKYLDLLKRDVEIPERIKNRVLRENSWSDIDGKNISRTILEIAGSEIQKIERRNSDCMISFKEDEKKDKKTWYPTFLPHFGSNKEQAKHTVVEPPGLLPVSSTSITLSSIRPPVTLRLNTLPDSPPDSP